MREKRTTTKRRCKIKTAAAAVPMLVPINQSVVMIDRHKYDDKQKFFPVTQSESVRVAQITVQRLGHSEKQWKKHVFVCP